MKIQQARSFGTYRTSSIVLLAAVAFTAAYPQRAEQNVIRDSPMARFGVIWRNQLTRSGLPRDDQGWMWLRQRGVRSIVSFRPENDIDYRKFGFEHVLRLPLTRSVMPTQDQALEYLKFIQNPANQPVHIHCSAGVGRTGMMAALARYSIDGWTLDRALDEARRYRGGKELSARRMAWLRAWAKSYPPASFRLRTD
jgi:Tyrosine phosphatase family